MNSTPCDGLSTNTRRDPSTPTYRVTPMFPIQWALYFDRVVSRSIRFDVYGWGARFKICVPWQLKHVCYNRLENEGESCPRPRFRLRLKSVRRKQPRSRQSL